MNKSLGPCPVCSDKLEITELSCESCATVMKGHFGNLAFSELSKEQIDFIKVFVKCRGNIKEVEKELNISYPTVRNKLNEVIESMGYEVDESGEEEKNTKEEVLCMIKEGKITVEEAVKLLKKKI